VKLPVNELIEAYGIVNQHSLGYTIHNKFIYRVSKGYQSTRHTVISSRGHAVTRSTRHIHVSSHSQLVI